MEAPGAGTLKPDDEGAVRDSAEERVLAETAKAAWLRPLEVYPGWQFGIDFDRSDAAFRNRRGLWETCASYRPLPRVRIPWLHGTFFEILVGNDLSRPIFVGGCYEPNEFAFLDVLLKPGMTFLDVGANEGIYTVFAAAKVGPGGRVHAVEPSSREHCRLEENIRINRFAQVRSHRIGLSDRQGTAGLLVASDAHAGQNTLGRFIYDQVTTSTVETVPLLPLDEFAEREGLDRCDVVKLDVEGAELAVLRGGVQFLRRTRPIILMEFQPKSLAAQGASTEDVLRFLRNLDYEIGTIGRLGVVERYTAGALSENIFAGPRCVLSDAMEEQRLRRIVELSNSRHMDDAERRLAEMTQELTARNARLAEVESLSARLSEEMKQARIRHARDQLVADSRIRELLQSRWRRLGQSLGLAGRTAWEDEFLAAPAKPPQE